MGTKIFAMFSVLLVFSLGSLGQTIRVKPVTPAPKAAPKLEKPSSYTIPSGTLIRVRMNSDISSATANVDDTFKTKLIGPLMVRGVVLLPEDTIIGGRVVKVVKASKKGTPGRLRVVFEKMTLPDGEILDIEGDLISIIDRNTDKESGNNASAPEVKGQSTTPEKVAMIGGGAGAGAIIGAIVGGTEGALVGAAVGAGVGTGGSLMRKGHEAILKDNSELSIVLKNEVLLPQKDY